MIGYSISRCVTPAASLGLIDVAQVKNELNIPASDTSKDAAIQDSINQVSEAINTYCDRIFVRQSYRDQFRSTYFGGLCVGTPLVVRQRPIVLDNGLPVLTVTENGVVVPVGEWEVDDKLGRLYRLDSAGNFSAWNGSPFVVDYDAGFTRIPYDIQAAALKSVTARYSNRGRDPMLRSQTIPDVVSESYFSSDTSSSSSSSLSSTALPAEAIRVLDAYVLRFM